MINDPIQNFIGFWSGLILVLIIAFWFHANLGARDRVTADQHRYIDEVLVPRFSAEWGAWAIDHPRDKEGSRGSHYQVIDAGDVKRGHVMRVAMKELYDRLAELGY